MATLLNIRTEARSRVREATADFWSDVEMNRYINFGYKNFIARTEWTERVNAKVITANQYFIDLPSDLMKINMVRWADQYEVKHEDIGEFAAKAGFSDAESDRPDMYTLWPTDAKMRIYPIPSASSASTTVSGIHTSSATTIAVTDATYFPERGRAIINSSEQILWFAKSGNSLTQVVRGDGYSTAASYVGGETIQYAPLEIYINYMPADLSADGDTTRVSSVYDQAFSDYAVFCAMMKKDMYKESSVYKTSYDELVKLAREERLRVQRDRQYFIKSEDYEGI